MNITDFRLWIQILVSHQIINAKTEIQIQCVLILKRIIAFRLRQNQQYVKKLTKNAFR
jgi:hypothetical protein